MADITKIDTFIQRFSHPSWLATMQAHYIRPRSALVGFRAMVARVDSGMPRAMSSSRARSFLLCLLSLWLTATFSLGKSHQSELQRIVSPATKYLSLKRNLVPQ
jgi:hypothetical protein